MKRAIWIMAALLVGCGGGDGDSAVAPQPEPAPAPAEGLSIGLSDAPADGVSHLILQMHSLELTPGGHMGGHHGGGDPIVLDMSQHRVDMLAYQGDDAYPLLHQHHLEPGRYQLRLHWTPGTGDHGSYVDDGEGRHPLHGDHPYFDLGEVTIHEGQHHNFTLEMDLRQGLHHDGEHYALAHHGMRWVDNDTMGHLKGTVDASWIADCEADNASLAGPDSQFVHVAYLYPDGTALAQMDDIAPEAADGQVAPLATSWVHQDHNGDWVFGVGFLPAGRYQVGYTCLGHLDQPDSNEAADEDFALYRDGGVVIIESGENGGHHNTHRCGG
ncbi:DUF4382 domain-containing protein [Ferrimonas balearica]|uniref:DUF4382 domain-containing protein n=1 Tax=Ferrimonas balearica TaxID=44012 RepID=UPI001F21E60B|nr:DUF4382 domain-containing protein [Ferrimonas balearica]MBY6096243.1 DUF4382 domain-containing protein [Ferrimonas balearica]